MAWKKETRTMYFSNSNSKEITKRVEKISKEVDGTLKCFCTLKT